MAADGSIVIETEIDNKQAQKELSALERDIARTQKEIDRLEAGKGELSQRFEQASAAADEAALHIRRMKEELREAQAALDPGNAQGFDLPLEEFNRYRDVLQSLPGEIAQQEKEFQKLAGESDRLNAKLQAQEDKLAAATLELGRQEEAAGKLAREVTRGAESYDSMAESAKVADQSIVDMAKELEELKALQAELEKRGIGLGYEEYDRTLAKIKELTAALKEYKAQQGGTGKKEAAKPAKTQTADTSRAEAAGQRLKSILGKVQEGARAGARAVGRIGSIAASAFGTAARAAGAFIKRMNVFSRLAEGMGGTFKRLGGLIKSAFVFNVISQGLTALRGQISAYLNTNAAFASALNQLKSALSTAFQPILSAAVPAIITLMNVLSRAIAVIGQFIAALFAIGGKKLKTNTKALGAEAEAIGGAGAAAEEASKSLAAFDEINQLAADPSGGGGGGGGGGVDIEDPFAGMEFETDFDSWGAAFDAFLDKILNQGIPALRKGFEEFANWLNTFSKNLYEMFTFPGVKAKVELIGQELAGAFNDLVNAIDWNLLGHALGAGLNLALLLATNFIYTFDWINLGRRLAEFFNGLAAEIDWYEFGRLLWAGFKIGLETLAGFLIGLDMPQVAGALSSLIKGFFNSAMETVNNINWGLIGAQIAAFLNNFDWYGTITSALGAITAGLHGLKDLVDNAIRAWNWQETARQIYTAINLAVSQINWRGIGETLGGLFSTALGFLLTAIGRVNWAGIGLGLAQSLNGLVANIQWADLGRNLGNAFVGVLNGLTAFLAEVDWAAIGQGVATELSSIPWAEVLISVGNAIGAAFLGALDLLIGFIEGMDWTATTNALVDGLQKMGQNVPWDQVASKLFELLGAAIGAAVAAVQTLCKRIWETIFDGLKSVGEYFNDKIEECGGNIVQGIFKGILDALAGVANWVKEHIWQPFINGFKSAFGIHSPATTMIGPGGDIIAGLLQGITEAWGSIVSFFSEKLSAIKETIGKAWEAIKNTTQSIWQGITTTLGGVWEDIKTAAGEKFTQAKDAIGKAWEAAKTTTGEIWDKVSTTVKTTWDNIKSAAKEKFDAAKDHIADAWQAAQNNTNETWNVVSNFLGTTWENLKTSAGIKFENIKTAIGEKWEAMKRTSEDTWKNLSTNLGKTWENMKSGAVKTFEGLKTGVLGIFNGLRDGIRSVINTIIGFVENMANKVVSGINTVIGGINSINIGGFSFNIPTVGNISIPRLATGAVIPPNQEFLAVLGDQRSGNNVEAPEGLIRKIVREEAGGNTQLLEAILEAIKAGRVMTVDRRVLARTVTEEQNRMTRAGGKAVLLG